MRGITNSTKSNIDKNIKCFLKQNYNVFARPIARSEASTSKKVSLFDGIENNFVCVCTLVNWL